MTIKEIADLCGVSESTIRNWINRAVELGQVKRPSAEIAKVENSPFDFTLEETLAIISEGGGNKTLASLLAGNAANKNAVAVYTLREPSDDLKAEVSRLLDEKLKDYFGALPTKPAHYVAGRPTFDRPHQPRRQRNIQFSDEEWDLIKDKAYVRRITIREYICWLTTQDQGEPK